MLSAKNQADTEISLSTSKLDWLENVIKKAGKLLQSGDNNTSVRQKARSMQEQMNKLSSVGDKLLAKWTWTGWYGVNHLQSIKENDNETTEYWEENAKKPKSIRHKMMFFVKGYTEDDLRIKCNELYHKKREINNCLYEITSTFYVDLGVNEDTTFADLKQKERDICKSITAVKEPYEKKK